MVAREADREAAREAAREADRSAAMLRWNNLLEKENQIVEEAIQKRLEEVKAMQEYARISVT